MAQENSPAHIGKTIVICGEVKGSEDLILDGRVEGTVNLELRSGCNLQGDIRALRLAVEDNAVFHGKVDLTQGVSRPPDAAAPQTGNGSPGSGS